MMKIRFVLEELYRSFWSSWFKDILLMIMFSISLLMAVLMCSYYLDLGERQPDGAEYENSAWYDVSIPMDKQADQEFTNSMATVRGCVNLMHYYETLSSSEEHPIISLSHNGTYMREKAAKKVFGDRDYTGFLAEDRKTAFSAYVENKGELILDFKAYQANREAYEYLELQTVEGEGFTEQNMTIEKATDAIPVVFGYDYRGILHVGQKIELLGVDEVYSCRVAGILEKGAELPENGDVRAGMLSLDSYILFPFGVRVKETPEKTEDIEKLARLDYEAFWNAIIKVENEKELDKLVDELRAAGEEFELPAVEVAGISLGITLLRNESVTSIRILLILTVILLCFSFYGLFVTFYDKIQSNSRVYGIYLMNGCSLWMILLPCLLETALILLPAVLISRSVFTFENVGGVSDMEIILRTAYIIVGLAFFAGAGAVVYLMRGVDTEHLIRQKD